ncbi:MAG: polysulfide reductase NrfD [Verrucomicrobia bacterium]|nr:polysulfide reductase NrfD [Verrucomicrobiota bacterium]
MGGIAVTIQLKNGIGVWGNNNSVMWGLPIVNFVWWIGIGHAGTLISAILLLLKQEWRSSIHRLAEAMTVAAVICAAVFPIIHLGRSWLAYYLFPLPGLSAVFPNFKSPLTWDVFAVGTYMTVSILFLHFGMLPELKYLAKHSSGRLRKKVYSAISGNWEVGIRNILIYKRTYKVLAIFCTALVVSVHSIVGLDFAVSILPGWNYTMFPPYFVLGAIYSGLAMVATLVIPIRRYYKLEYIIKSNHIDMLIKTMLWCGTCILYFHIIEAVKACINGNSFDCVSFMMRYSGEYALLNYIMLICSLGTIHLLWISSISRCYTAVFIISVLVNIGMWLERYIIIIHSQSYSYLKGSWDVYHPTINDIITTMGSFGLFGVLMLSFIRYIPIVSVIDINKYNDN